MQDVEIPNSTLTEFVFSKALQYPDRAALVDGPTGRTLTYGQLVATIKKVAAGLHHRGFSKGNVLAILSPNIPEYAVIFHSVASLGGINTTLNPLYTVDEIANQLKDCNAKFMVTVAPLLDKAKEACAKANVEEIFVVGQAEGATPFSSLLAHGENFPDPKIDPAQDIVVLPYSSGTTGLPKGVMLTHRNIVANICQFAPMLDLGDHDRCIAVLPFFHIYGMVVILNNAVRAGGTAITMPRFELEPFLQILQDHKITTAYVVPPIVLALAKHPAVDKFDLSSLKMVMSGAAPLDDGVASVCSKRLNARVFQGYGMTETSPVTHVIPRAANNAPYGSAGMLVPNTQCRVVDPATGKDVGTMERGEICVRGPQVMKGYLNRPDATNAMIDTDGWLHTGDIGYADENGFFFIVDRVKELIKYKGMQVAPAELEAVLLSHPNVADAAVIGSPDEEAGEVPKGFVVLKHPTPSEELLHFVAERVAPHKKIRLLEVIDQVPKSATGKILRRVLVERERARLHNQNQ